MHRRVHPGRVFYMEWSYKNTEKWDKIKIGRDNEIK